MDFITTTILSGAIYDLFRSGVALGAEQLKNKLKDWLVSEEQAHEMVLLLNESGIHEDLGQHAIKRRINENPSLLELLKAIKSNEKTTQITQQVDAGVSVVNDGGEVSIGSISITKV